jgi:MFS family permease
VLANLDLFIVNVALPNIAGDFNDANLGSLSWILNGYDRLRGPAGVCGRLAERYPRNISFLAGIALFTVASAACALANSVGTLVAFRRRGRKRPRAQPHQRRQRQSDTNARRDDA